MGLHQIIFLFYLAFTNNNMQRTRGYHSMNWLYDITSHLYRSIAIKF